MSADGELTGKSKGRKDGQDEADIDELIDKDGRLDLNELETIPTVVPPKPHASACIFSVGTPM
jgi:hypothetical protein